MNPRIPVLALSLPLAALALLAAAASLEAQPSGRYEARPGAVLAAGGFAGFADVLLQIEGSLELDITSLPFPGSDPVVRFGSSDLRLHPVSSQGLGPGPFPPPGGPSLADLEAAPRPGGGWIFTSPPSFPDDEVSLELIPTGDSELLLRGTWTEACCDRFAYELLGVIFDFSGPGGAPGLRLADGRFEVVVRWQDHAGGAGSGTPVKLDERSGRIWFFDPRNPELLVKVIDGCETFGSWWFFVAGLTDVGVEIEVHDLGLGPTKTYSRPRGVPFAPILDTDAFVCALP